MFSVTLLSLHWDFVCLFFVYCTEIFVNFKVMADKCKDLNLREKSEVLKKYDKLPKCSQQEAAMTLRFFQTSFSCIKSRKEL